MLQDKSNSCQLPSRGFVDCFGCSPYNSKGLKLGIWYTEKGCMSYYSIPSEYCGFKGLAHGGIIATLLDEVAAWTIIAQLFRVGITRQISIHYLKPIPTGEELEIEGKLIQKDEQNAVVHTYIRSKEGVLLAEAESKWLLPTFSTIEEITGIKKEEMEKTIKRIVDPIHEVIQKQKRRAINK
ncbi:MAG: PaaI family thioesterase [Candidatus Hodarchaeota archaeon]